MKKVINLNIPHIGEKIFENIGTNDLIEWLKVSKTWKILIENVLLKRWKGKLMEASRYGKFEIVKLLLERTDEQLNVRDIDGRTALHWACRKGHKDVVQLLMNCQNKNIELNTRNNNGRTAFMLACQNGHTDVVQLLLNSVQNIELNTRGNDGYTAFQLACSKRHSDVVMLLLANNNINVNK